MTVLRSRTKLRWAVLAVVAVGAVVVAMVAGAGGRSTRNGNAAFTEKLDPGTRLTGQAPDFTLTDQFNRPVSLRSFRGRVVILAFNDSECTTVCPLTTTAMVSAQRLLGRAASQVALLGVDANPDAISVKDVRSYSEAHGMTRQWQFLTGSLPELRRVWRAYHIDVAIEHGEIDHTPALFVIDTHGRLAKLYLTQVAYASVDQQAQLLAQEASSLLPGHPRVQTSLSYAQVPSISPTASATLPRAGGGTVRVGPGAARLYAFFATWDSQVTNLGGQLDALNRYQSQAAAQRLPGLTAVDEATVEPSANALPKFFRSLPGPLGYPVAIDRSGRLADGYGVQDEPWFVLMSPAGKVVWYYDVSTSGWLSTSALSRRVRAALARPPAPSGAADQALLAGSPAPLAALHQQANRLLGGQSTLPARLRALRGYPVVLNAWASWCGPCKAEFGLFASASARFGRRVAFLGVDTDDSSGDARAFLSRHHVAYPSYQGSTGGLRSIAVVAGLPTTIFIDRTGKVAYVHTGQYDAQGTLDQDIADHAS
jgi:cytochrome oxidase Cu insertion factor (SCO1/SenC/PrrC family)/thiol-disulfide isomerase/thioredoxin